MCISGAKSGVGSWVIGLGCHAIYEPRRDLLGPPLHNIWSRRSEENRHFLALVNRRWWEADQKIGNCVSLVQFDEDRVFARATAGRRWNPSMRRSLSQSFRKYIMQDGNI